MKVLFISQLYPNRYDPMPGLFVRKHAQAVGLYADVAVLYVHPDDKIDKTEIIRQTSGNISETYLYFPANCSRIVKHFRYFRTYITGFNEIKKQWGKPDLIQANIFTRTAFIAYSYHLAYKIPYAVIEHWTRYFREKTFNNKIHRYVSIWVARQANAVMPVTAHLQHCMEQHGMHNNNYRVINNVVDDGFFEKTTMSGGADKIKILNVTCFNDDQKNISGILRVVNQLYKKRTDFEITLVGTGEDFQEIIEFAREMEIDPSAIKFAGLLEGDDLMEIYKQCDFTLLFSNYENIPVVLSESLACGKPVISTNVGGIAEHINDSNGILISRGDETGLFDSIDYMLDNYKKYDAKTIAADAEKKYSFNAVGKNIIDIYNEILHS